MTEQHAAGEMTLIEHLTELRAVIAHSLIALALATIGAWFISGPAVDFLVQPAVGVVGDLKFTQPTGAFMFQLKTAFGVGFLVAVPFVLWRIWSFVAPGLLRKERKVMTPVTLASILLFYGGVAFAHFLILPLAIPFFLGFSTDFMQPLITVEHYFDFAVRLMLAFGGVFQFPLVVILLTWWGILDPKLLQKYWRWGVVGIFVLSALLTPPDPVSQLLMAGPVLVLYGVSMLIAMQIAKRKKRARDEAERGE